MSWTELAREALEEVMMDLAARRPVGTDLDRWIKDVHFLARQAGDAGRPQEVRALNAIKSELELARTSLRRGHRRTASRALRNAILLLEDWDRGWG